MSLFQGTYTYGVNGMFCFEGTTRVWTECFVLRERHGCELNVLFWENDTGVNWMFCFQGTYTRVWTSSRSLNVVRWFDLYAWRTSDQRTIRTRTNWCTPLRPDSVTKRSFLRLSKSPCAVVPRSTSPSDRRGKEPKPGSDQSVRHGEEPKPGSDQWRRERGGEAAPGAGGQGAPKV